jgi:hypothetical protein
MTKKPPTTIAEAVGVSSPRVGAPVRRRLVEEAVNEMRHEGVPLDSPEAGERIRRVVRKSRAEAKRHVETGTKIRWRSDKGGRRPDANRDRNVAMAKEFQQRKAKMGNKSDSKLKEEVGKDERFGLSRRSAIDAVNKGLKILCSIAAKPHD